MQQEAGPAAPPALEPPKLLEFFAATYPAEAERARLEATVLLRLTLDARGQVTEAEVLAPAGHGFDEAAREAALRFRFEPAKRNGTPMPSRIAYSYEFRLPTAEASVQTVAPPRHTEASAGVAPAPERTEPAAQAAPEPARTAVPAEGSAAPASTEEAIEVTVEGESEAERRRQSAEAVQVIETENLQREAVDLGQALARTQGINVQRAGGLGSRARFSLAGLTDEQVRFFIDGVPLELAGFGPDFASVPVNLIQRVELYQGVVPIRFGADALGGAVQLVTIDDIQGTRASASYELGSFDTHRLTVSGRHLVESRGLFVRASGFFDSSPNDYLIDVTVDDSQGRPVPATLPRFHDAYRALGGGVEAGFVDRPWARRLLLRAFASDAAKEIQHDTAMKAKYGEVDSGNTSAGATLRYEHTFGASLLVDAVGGYVAREARFADLGRCAYDWYGRCIRELPQQGETESRAIDRSVNQGTGFARLNLAWNLATDHALRFSLAPTLVTRTGEDRQLRARGELDPLSGKRAISTLVGGAEYELDAFDGRLENIAFLKLYGQLLRVDRLLPSNTFVPFNKDTFEPGFGDSLRFRLSRQLSAKASYEWATRLPRADELLGDGILTGENLDLERETSHNVNLELTLDLPETRAGAFRGSVAGFGRLADQLIIRLGEQGYFTYQNVITARALGTTGAAGWTSPEGLLSLDGNVTWLDLRNVSSDGPFGDFEGQRIPNQPHVLGNGSARLQLDDVLSPRDALSLTWHTRYVHSFFRAWEKLGREDTKTVISSQFLHSLALTYVIRSGPTTLSWTLDAQNLTDARAFDFYGVQRPGRTLSAKVVAEL
ncbi:TonB-dependent siderophore myxochelin receptor MxcH [Pyxidicoccus xibeiensis]|uniref:TonB-dependent siderophore myxochelin receptor MxcH n=1 Tax=Pyxidicoccus xibeiensis TaxID=2906759 RepID=UPI0020A7D7F5|nr:TonB-dependent siderophore myxochelin receptor MxcH [Pyxidicoccus xibeiensis]MCP3144858.1 TonB-dependent siderophore myxochelin receptor MxcH [Pyxidicoccus xibeiensis]